MVLSSRCLGAVAGQELLADAAACQQEALLAGSPQRLVQRLALEDPLEGGLEETALQRAAEPRPPRLHLPAAPRRLVEGSWAGTG